VPVNFIPINISSLPGFGKVRAVVAVTILLFVVVVLAPVAGVKVIVSPSV